jgi:hypothetical protein
MVDCIIGEDDCMATVVVSVKFLSEMFLREQLFTRFNPFFLMKFLSQMFLRYQLFPRSIFRSNKARRFMSKGKPSVLVVWDFDWSLINENSDTYIVEQFSAELHESMVRGEVREKYPQWTNRMAECFRQLHQAHNAKQTELNEKLRNIPVVNCCPNSNSVIESSFIVS